MTFKAQLRSPLFFSPESIPSRVMRNAHGAQPGRSRSFKQEAVRLSECSLLVPSSQSASPHSFKPNHVPGHHYAMVVASMKLGVVVNDHKPVLQRSHILSAKEPLFFKDLT